MGHMFLVCTLEKACFVVLENEHNAALIWKEGALRSLTERRVLHPS